MSGSQEGFGKIWGCLLDLESCKLSLAGDSHQSSEDRNAGRKVHSEGQAQEASVGIRILLLVGLMAQCFMLWKKICLNFCHVWRSGWRLRLICSIK